MRIAIVTASINKDVLNKNLLASKFVKECSEYVMEGFNNVPEAYNIAIERDKKLNHDIIIFVHDDVFLPPDFESNVKKELSRLPDNWGVCGVAGAWAYTAPDKKLYKICRGNVNDRGREWGKQLEEPIEVQTLDELMLIVNMKHGLRFDDQFPLDFYGADICMQALEKGLKVHVIQAYVHHNSSRAFGGRTPGFFESEAKFKEKWKHRLPIATTCALLK